MLINVLQQERVKYEAVRHYGYISLCTLLSHLMAWFSFILNVSIMIVPQRTGDAKIMLNVPVNNCFPWLDYIFLCNITKYGSDLPQKGGGGCQPPCLKKIYQPRGVVNILGPPWTWGLITCPHPLLQCLSSDFSDSLVSSASDTSDLLWSGGGFGMTIWVFIATGIWQLVPVTGLQTRMGSRVWVARVRVRVCHDVPVQNPHPAPRVWWVFPGTQIIKCHCHFTSPTTSTRPQARGHARDTRTRAPEHDDAAVGRWEGTRRTRVGMGCRAHPHKRYIFKFKYIAT